MPKVYPSLKFTLLKEAKPIPQNSVSKIQRVAHHLRDRENFAKHYSPRFMSIGPIHYGAMNLQEGKKYKLMWAASYLESTQLDAQTLYQKIASNIEHLKELFAEDVIRDFENIASNIKQMNVIGDDEKLPWLLFVDGCSLLQILDKGKLENPEDMNVKVDQLVLVLQDVLLLENQLPYQVLQLLSGHENDAMLLNTMDEFFKSHHLLPYKPKLGSKTKDKVKTNDKDSKSGEWYNLQRVQSVEIPQEEASVEIPQEEAAQQGESPIHLLDQLHKYVVDEPDKNHQDQKEQNKNDKFKRITYRNIQELKAAGIKLKTNKTGRLRDISFSYRWKCLCGELRLPEITVDDTTATTFLNLIAYEMCPDIKNKYQISSFVAFMDTLIDHPDDVKELRSAGVLLNLLGSDEEVAKLFNSISTDLVATMESYSDVRGQIEKHCRNKCRTWIAVGYHNHFSNPWAIIALLATVIALVLTFIQTLFAINPAD